MKTRILVLIALAAVFQYPSSALAGGRDQVIKILLGVATGAAASASIAETGAAVLDYQEGLVHCNR